jgi:hypothetical protein
MRTTVDIDEHLLAEAKVLAARQHRTLGQVIDDSLRSTLSPVTGPSRPVRLTTYGGREGVPLVDILDKEALAEVLGDNEWPRRDDADS